MTLLYSALTIGVTIAAIAFFFSFVPDVSEYPLPEDIGDSIATAFGYVNAWNYFIALDTLILIVKLVLAIEFIILVFHLVRWVSRMVLRISS